MIKLSNQELLAVNGGLKWTISLGIGAIVAFLIGVIDGFTRPYKCR